MTKQKKGDRLIVEAKDKGLAVFSYNGLGFAANIGDHDIDEVFDIAKSAIKKQMEKENVEGQQEGEEVRTEDEQLKGESSESVDGDTSTGGVSSEVHGPEKSDIR